MHIDEYLAYFFSVRIEIDQNKVTFPQIAFVVFSWQIMLRSILNSESENDKKYSKALSSDSYHIFLIRLQTIISFNRRASRTHSEIFNYITQWNVIDKEVLHLQRCDLLY